MLRRYPEDVYLYKESHWGLRRPWGATLWRSFFLTCSCSYTCKSPEASMEALWNAVTESRRGTKALRSEALLGGVLRACAHFEGNGEVAGYACSVLGWLDDGPELQRKAASIRLLEGEGEERGRGGKKNKRGEMGNACIHPLSFLRDTVERVKPPS